MLFSIIRAMAGLEAGRACQSCHEPIDPRDEFGISEYICRPCRDA